MCPLLPPIKGVLEAEKSLFDLTKVIGGDVLLSQKCWRAFEEAGIQGLADPLPVDMVEVRGPVDRKLAENYLLARVQPGASVDRVKSGLKTSEGDVCPVCGSAGTIEGYDRVAVDMDSWLGLDVFRVNGLPGPILVAPRVREVCQDSALSICKLVPAECYSL
jgi:hypothetical protein